MTAPLLVVDVQNGFINEFTHHIPRRVVQLIEKRQYAPILFTQFVNSSDGPYTQFLNWQGCNQEPEIDLVDELQSYVTPQSLFPKPGLCGLPERLIHYLKENNVKRISVVGIDTDMCVLKIAMDLFDRGIEPIVLTDCCASTAGLQAHLAGLAVLSRNIGAQRLREAGLGNGSLAAPALEDDRG